MKKRVLALCVLIPSWFFALSLEEQVCCDLESIGITHIEFPSAEDSEHIFDVAIIGGGQSGMALSLALQKQHIFNFAIFDKAPCDLEGTWVKAARMLTLRSVKEGLVSPSLDLPHLDFRTWFELNYTTWDTVDKVPTAIWAEYLFWYKKALNLKIHNQWELLSIESHQNYFTLIFNEAREVKARHVVLATGRGGCGGVEIPEWALSVEKKLWFHTAEEIDSHLFKEKRIAILGAGASGFDMAATALESGALRVDMLMRKEKIVEEFVPDPCEDWEQCYMLSDESKADYFQKVLNQGTPPPVESRARIAHWNNFALHPQTEVQRAYSDACVHLQTNQGELVCDYLVLATGFAVDLKKTPELSAFADNVLVWGDKYTQFSSKVAQFPYLGPYFEFLEKSPGAAPYVKRIHCFNYGAFLSHGCISGDISELSIGVTRLAEGIASDLAHLRHE